MEIKTCKIFLQKVSIILLILYIFSNIAIADLDKDLLSAINRNSYGEFISLLEKGANPNAKDGRGVPVIYNAINSKKEEMAKALILKGASTSDSYFNNMSALALSINHQLNEIASLLIDRGVDISVTTKSGTNVLMLAVKRDMPEIVKKILSKKTIDINAKDKNGRTPLSIALSEINLKMALLLKSEGALPSNLLESSLISDFESLKKFIDLKAELEVRDIYGHTPLIIAFLSHNYEIASYLLKNKADINARNNAGQSPALIAAMQSDTEMLSLALQYNADVLLGDANGLTPLSYAIFFDNYEIIGQIIEYNKSAIDAVDKNGCMPLIFAIVKPDKKIALRLISLGANLNIKKARSVLTSVIGIEDIEMTERLIKDGARVNMKSSSYVSPLLMAINRNNYEIVKLLIQRGTNLDAKDRKGNTAIDYARKYADKKLMQLLSERGIFTKNKKVA
ncbi:MAG: ankyrin repeat domain-containing protein [Clostridiales Family XIII bacterium]|jgi:ankyrin repeat protein|nr:ankyrin repeat domain-containing protein [Clostridiales Family XIII bacterium]